MDRRALLKTYIEQGKEYKKMLERVNHHGKHSSNIKVIEEKLKIAAQTLKRI
ncbi:MAG: hypothetical protein AAGU27_03380 [Dehalobacterium sp.]